MVSTKAKTNLTSTKKKQGGKSPMYYEEIERKLQFLEKMEEEGTLTEAEKKEKKKLYNQLSAKRSRDTKAQQLNQAIELVDSLKTEIKTRDDIITGLVLQIQKTNEELAQLKQLLLIGQNIQTQPKQRSAEDNMTSENQLTTRFDFHEGGILDYPESPLMNSETDSTGVDNISEDASVIPIDEDIWSLWGRQYSLSTIIIVSFIIIAGFVAILSSSPHSLGSKIPLVLQGVSDLQNQIVLKDFSPPQIGGDIIQANGSFVRSIEKGFNYKNSLVLISESGALSPAHIFTQFEPLGRKYFYLNNLIDAYDITKYFTTNGDISTNSLYKNFESNTSHTPSIPLDLTDSIESERVLSSIIAAEDAKSLPTSESILSDIILIPYLNITHGDRVYVFCKQKCFDNGQILSDSVLLRFSQAETKSY